MEREFNGAVLSDEQSRISLDDVCALLAKSYWGSERSRETVERSLRNSLCFGAYKDGRQVAFARAVTDYATSFWLCDVIVEEGLRGAGLGKALIDFALASKSLEGLNGVLATKDAHGLYEKFGFARFDGLFMGRKRAPGG